MITRRHMRGFTLMEMVVAIAIGSVVVIFAGMFITAPVDAYEAHSRRSKLIADASTAWPRIQADLRHALPNSVRATRNGNLVVLEMLDTVGYAKFEAPPSAEFAVTGTPNGIFGSYQPGARFPGHLSVGNTGAEAYTQAGSMTPRLPDIELAVDGSGTPVVRPGMPIVLPRPSARSRIYLVRGFVAYVCDERVGTIRRYQGTTIVANAAAHDSPAELGGAGELAAQGLGACTFDAPLVAGQPQVVTARLTTASRYNESVTVMYRAVVENPP